MLLLYGKYTASCLYGDGQPAVGHPTADRAIYCSEPWMPEGATCYAGIVRRTRVQLNSQSSQDLNLQYEALTALQGTNVTGLHLKVCIQPFPTVDSIRSHGNPRTRAPEDERQKLRTT